MIDNLQSSLFKEHFPILAPDGSSERFIVIMDKLNLFKSDISKFHDDLKINNAIISDFGLSCLNKGLNVYIEESETRMTKTESVIGQIQDSQLLNDIAKAESIFDDFLKSKDFVDFESLENTSIFDINSRFSQIEVMTQLTFEKTICIDNGYPSVCNHAPLFDLESYEQDLKEFKGMNNRVVIDLEALLAKLDFGNKIINSLNELLKQFCNSPGINIFERIQAAKDNFSDNMLQFKTHVNTLAQVYVNQNELRTHIQLSRFNKAASSIKSVCPDSYDSLTSYNELQQEANCIQQCFTTFSLEFQKQNFNHYSKFKELKTKWDYIADDSNHVCSKFPSDFLDNLATRAASIVTECAKDQGLQYTISTGLSKLQSAATDAKEWFQVHIPTTRSKLGSSSVLSQWSYFDSEFQLLLNRFEGISIECDRAEREIQALAHSFVKDFPRVIESTSFDYSSIELHLFNNKHIIASKLQPCEYYRFIDKAKSINAQINNLEEYTRRNKGVICRDSQNSKPIICSTLNLGQKDLSNEIELLGSSFDIKFQWSKILDNNVNRLLFHLEYILKEYISSLTPNLNGFLSSIDFAKKELLFIIPELTQLRFEFNSVSFAEIYKQRWDSYQTAVYHLKNLEFYSQISIVLNNKKFNEIYDFWRQTIDWFNYLLNSTVTGVFRNLNSVISLAYEDNVHFIPLSIRNDEFSIQIKYVAQFIQYLQFGKFMDYIGKQLDIVSDSHAAFRKRVIAFEISFNELALNTRSPHVLICKELSELAKTSPADFLVQAYESATTKGQILLLLKEINFFFCFNLGVTVENLKKAINLIKNRNEITSAFDYSINQMIKHVDTLMKGVKVGVEELIKFYESCVEKNSGEEVSCGMALLHEILSDFQNILLLLDAVGTMNRACLMSFTHSEDTSFWEWNEDQKKNMFNPPSPNFQGFVAKPSIAPFSRKKDEKKNDSDKDQQNKHGNDNTDKKNSQDATTSNQLPTVAVIFITLGSVFVAAVLGLVIFRVWTTMRSEFKIGRRVNPLISGV